MSKVAELQALRRSYSVDTLLNVQSRSGDATSALSRLDLYAYTQSAEADIIEAEERAELRAGTKKFAQLLGVFFKRILTASEFEFFAACTRSNNRTPCAIGRDMGVNYEEYINAIIAKYTKTLPRLAMVMQSYGYAVPRGANTFMPQWSRYLELKELRRQWWQSLSEEKREKYRVMRRANMQLRRAANRDAWNAARREYRARHRDTINEHQRQYYKAVGSVRRRERWQSLTEEQREEHNAKRRELDRNRREANREQYRESKRQYYAANIERERVRALRYYYEQHEEIRARQNENARKLRAADPEKAREKERRKRAAHREELREKQKRYYAAHRELCCERTRRWNEAHREKVLERKRQYREAHRAEISEKGKQYRAANKEKIQEYQKQYREQKKRAAV